MVLPICPCRLRPGKSLCMIAPCSATATTIYFPTPKARIIDQVNIAPLSRANLFLSFLKILLSPRYYSTNHLQALIYTCLDYLTCRLLHKIKIGPPPTATGAHPTRDRQSDQTRAETDHPH